MSDERRSQGRVPAYNDELQTNNPIVQHGFDHP
jgi:hypothetical protein